MKRLYLLLLPALLLCSPSLAQERTGTVTLYLDHFFGLKPNGALDPSANKLCEEKFRDYAGTATTTYKINPKTLVMSAETTFHSSTYQLYPFGILGKYAFGSSQRHTPPIHQVLFAISTEFTNPNNRVVLLLNKSTNCALTNLGAL
jgi:hypothetical protein